MTITLDRHLAEACMMRRCSRYLAAVRGKPYTAPALAHERAELWADALSQPETRMGAWVGMADIRGQTGAVWER